jgi:hypothetical protein
MEKVITEAQESDRKGEDHGLGQGFFTTLGSEAHTESLSQNFTILHQGRGVLTPTPC